MAEAANVFLSCESFIEMLKGLPWCRQGDGTLVAVYKCTPEIVEALRVHEVKVFPGGIPVKIAKSWLSYMDEQDRDGNPVPVLVVWKPAGVELWYRRHKSYEFPYDTWQDAAAAAYEREMAFVPSSSLGADCEETRKEISGRVKDCPAMIRIL